MLGFSVLLLIVFVFFVSRLLSAICVNSIFVSVHQIHYFFLFFFGNDNIVFLHVVNTVKKEHLKELKAGRAIDCPVYDYSLHNRSDEVIRIEPKPVILVEGILLLADERIRDLLDIKIYVEADADERILRRISRDVEERGRDLNGIIKQYLTTVKPMHYLYVEPTRSKADIVINSGKNDVAFDLFVSKIEQLLDEMNQ